MCYCHCPHHSDLCCLYCSISYCFCSRHSDRYCTVVSLLSFWLLLLLLSVYPSFLCKRMVVFRFKKEPARGTVPAVQDGRESVFIWGMCAFRAPIDSGWVCMLPERKLAVPGFEDARILDISSYLLLLLWPRGSLLYDHCYGHCSMVIVIVIVPGHCCYGHCYSHCCMVIVIVIAPGHCCHGHCYSHCFWSLLYDQC